MKICYKSNKLHLQAGEISDKWYAAPQFLKNKFAMHALKSLIFSHINLLKNYFFVIFLFSSKFLIQVNYTNCYTIIRSARTQARIANPTIVFILRRSRSLINSINWTWYIIFSKGLYVFNFLGTIMLGTL